MGSSNWKRKQKAKRQYKGMGKDVNVRTYSSIYREPKAMHSAVCCDCHRICEVPFIPIEGKKVYCKDCLDLKKLREMRKCNKV